MSTNTKLFVHWCDHLPESRTRRSPASLARFRSTRSQRWFGTHSETLREIEDDQTGLVRVYDFANVGSVMAIHTEDLAIRRGAGAAFAEPRGGSWMEMRS